MHMCIYAAALPTTMPDMPDTTVESRSKYAFSIKYNCTLQLSIAARACVSVFYVCICIYVCSSATDDHAGHS